MRYSGDDLEYLRAKRAPELAGWVQADNLFFWQAFHHLRGSRQIGGAIPFGAISDYCEWAGVECPVQRTRLARVVITLDNAERDFNGRIASTT